MEAFDLCQVMSWFFYIPPQILDRRSTPTINSPGLLLSVLPKSTAKSNASFRRHYLDFLALFPLRNFTLPDGLTTRWQVDCYVTSVGNLERINSENICPDIKLYACIPKTDVFLTRFWEHMIPSTWRRKIHELKISVRVCWILQSKRNKLSE